MWNENEVVDLVDQNDQPIGEISRKDFEQLWGTPGYYIRASHAFIRNSRGQILLLRRQLNKKVAPGGLDFSVAEHMGVGESYLDAVVRGFEEELNLRVAPEDLKKIGKFEPTLQLPYFREMYLYEADIAEPDFDKEDFTDALWLTPADAVKQIRGGDKAKRELDLVIEKLFL